MRLRETLLILMVLGSGALSAQQPNNTSAEFRGGAV